MNVYDFDNTIYAGDSSIDFYLFCIKRHPSLMSCIPRQIVAAINYKLGKIDKVGFKEIFFSFLSKLDDPNKEVTLFWDSSETRIKSWYIDQQKENDLIISASPRFLLAEVCKRINIKYLIATEVDISSGRFKSNNYYGMEKVRRFNELYPQERIQMFYSDSMSDHFLAKLAEKAFIVTGNTVSSWPQE